MNLLDRLRGRKDPIDEKEHVEIEELRHDFDHAIERAVRAERSLEREIRRLEGAPWKR